MFVNIWSTPRTGSIWYACWMRDSFRRVFGSDKVDMIPEMFNPHHLGIYHKKSPEGLRNSHTWEDGFYYDDYSIEEEGRIVRQRKHEQRTRSLVDEASWRLWIVQAYFDRPYSKASVTVMHNHVTPIVSGAYDALLKNGVRNIYIYRKDIVAQLASYAVAYSTKTFSKFLPSVEYPHTGLHCDPEPLQTLANRIVYWHKLPKSSKDEIVAYEEMKFEERYGLPYKQNKMPAIDKLNKQTQDLILSLAASVDRSLGKVM